ncbi:MAG: hypothetical protein CSA83_01745 [Actinomycetales bacterium]|nr:MAG: hypothetical protein CSA83_01745 [Actinomycetales bacterium]
MVSAQDLWLVRKTNAGFFEENAGALTITLAQPALDREFSPLPALPPQGEGAPTNMLIKVVIFSWLGFYGFEQ